MNINYKRLTIDEFIQKFNQYESFQVLEKTFTQGFCYYFSIILKEKFPNGIIIYAPLENHFIFLYKEYLYDIRGNITNLYQNSQLKTWESYGDLLHKQRIIRDCIEHDEIYR